MKTMNLLGIVMVFVLSSCGNNGDEEGSTPEPVAAEAVIDAVATQVPEPVAAGTPNYLGAESCRACHESEFAEWEQSHHHMAMADPTPDAVLGDFDDATFTHFGREFRFSKRDDGKYIVNAEDGSGERRDYEVAYTFGLFPLQQYLLPTEGGRLQALQVCWDSRPEAEGGQRWYHLYPEEEIPPHDELHWTREHFNWNYMCADCHSTDLQKNFDVATATYNTTWKEMNVSCEACHGPGSAHVAWADDPDAYAGDAAMMGLTVKLKEDVPASWPTDPTTGQPKRSHPLESDVMVETCAPCHAHRRILQGGSAIAGSGSLLNSHVPSVLEQVLYHPDGQIKEEVYVYGSFTQSKMFHKGVRCTDCHHPHTMNLIAQGNSLCTRCHEAPAYDTPDHHFHGLADQIAGTERPTGQPGDGSSCVDCHMPGKHYMGVDFRRDHSFRVPRPDLSLTTGSPNACTMCHDDKDDAWAAAEAERLWPDSPHRATPHWGEAFAAAQTGAVDAEAQLIHAAAADTDFPDIVRATALDYMRRQAPTPGTAQSAFENLKDPDPLVRVSAVAFFQNLPPEQSVPNIAPLLSDDVAAVRHEAARIVARHRAQLQAGDIAAFDKASAEFMEAQKAVDDRAGGHMGRALMLADLGRPEEAVDEYRTAIRIEPSHIPSRINLAELLFQLGRPAEAGPILEEAALAAPNQPVVHESLGRFYVRTRDYPAALRSLARACELAPENARLHFFYGVALNSTGDFPSALPVLQRAAEIDPANPEYLSGLCTICRDAGQLDLARSYAEELVRRFPGQPGFQQLLDSLR